MQFERGKITLDADGLKLLAAALYLGVARELERLEAGKRYLRRLQARPDFHLLNLQEELEARGYVLLDEGDLPRVRERKWLTKQSVLKLELPEGIWRQARQTKLSDFWWRWHHVEHSPLLEVSLKPTRPEWSFDFPYPHSRISALGWSGLSEELTELTFTEIERLKSTGEPLDPPLHNPLLALRVSDICPLSGPGNPGGSDPVVELLASRVVNRILNDDKRPRRKVCADVLDFGPERYFADHDKPLPPHCFRAPDRDAAIQKIDNLAATLLEATEKV